VLVLELDTDNDWSYKLLASMRGGSLPVIPVVILSRLSPDEVDLPADACIHDWLTKPVKTKDLVGALSQAVHNGH
jgi:CheY-like chemotaxis protein